MSMNPDDFRKIIAAYLNGSLNQEDRTMLASLLMQPQYQEQLDTIMQEQQQKGYQIEPEFQESYQRMRKALQSRINTRPALIQRIWWVAAVAVLVLIAGIWFFTTDKSAGKSGAQQQHETAAIEQGRDGAILTLADGSKVVLDSMGNGTVTYQNGAELLLKNGQLEYKMDGAADEKEVYNTLTTPKGRQFRIVLPDGTIAWLNAASSIRFPTRFTKEVRRVEISGEVYFEAASLIQHGKKVPFVVTADNRCEVEVLGTQFNVNAYTDEPTLNTTLLEGKVTVTGFRTRQKVTLAPGQQASLSLRNDTQLELVVRKADPAKIMAWKNGMFNFEDVRIDEVMRQLKRWYDIEVVYESGVPDIEFIGKMTRDIPLNGLLIALEKSNVHFRLEGRTLVVMP